MFNSSHKGLISSITVYNERFKVYDAINGTVADSFARHVSDGLITFPKFLLAKYFYDTEGSELFEKICETPEYYVTRTESEILKKNVNEIASLNRDKRVIVELGSGSSVKTRYLLSSFLHNSSELMYMPIDVSGIMVASSENLLDEFENLKIDGILAEYETGLDIAGSVIKQPKIIIFLGSSIGNFNLHDAFDFVKHIARVMNDGDSFLIGFDMVKDINVLNSAYNDAEGYTAEFNLNLLKRINRELGGEFDLNRFKHKAFYNAAKSRIEMHVVSQGEQDVCIHSIKKAVHFNDGETIHTESSYKFTDEMINDISLHAGLELEKMWKDDKNYFSLCLMRKI